MDKFIKVYASDCEVCQSLKDRDEKLVRGLGYDFEAIPLESMSGKTNNISMYVVNYHVDKEGMVDVPIYLITTGEQNRIQASTVAKDIEDVRALHTAWEQYQAATKPAG